MFPALTTAWKRQLMSLMVFSQAFIMNLGRPLYKTASFIALIYSFIYYFRGIYMKGLYVSCPDLFVSITLNQLYMVQVFTVKKWLDR